MLVGGSVKKDDELKYGYYVEPTIIVGLPKKHRLFSEEMFVPILCAGDYEKFDDAIKLANDIEYGLTAGYLPENRKRSKSSLTTSRRELFMLTGRQAQRQAQWSDASHLADGSTLVLEVKEREGLIT